MSAEDFWLLTERVGLKGVEYYLSNGGAINGVYKDGMTPLFYAINNIYLSGDVVKNDASQCARKSSKSNRRDKKSEARLKARASFHDKIISQILSAGANLNEKEPSDGRTPLCLAIFRKLREEVIYKLINAGSKLSAKCNSGRTPLIYAIQRNYNKNMIDYLIAKGADVNHADNYGMTAVWNALVHRDKNLICSTLISAGANLNIYNKEGKHIMNDLSCQNKDCCRESDNIVNCQNKEVIDLFVANGLDLKLRDKNGCSSVHLAGCNYIISLCIRSGVSVDSKNYGGETPLLEAVYLRRVDRARDLIVLFNADVNCTNSELKTPLHYGHCYNNCKNVYNNCMPLLLLYHGADLNAKSIKNETALDSLLRVNYDPDLRADVRYGLANKWPTVCAAPVLKHFLLFVDENGLKDFYENAITKPHIYIFIDKCKQELKKMRSTFIKPGLSFYQFCLLRKFYKSKFVKISMDEYLYSDKEVKKMFPFYKNIILIRKEDNEKKTCKRNLLLCLENVIIKPLPVSEEDSNVQLVFDCKYHLGRYLNCKQIYNLFQASIDQ